MFKWPGLPSPRAPAHEVADFAELVCWRDGGTSLNTIVAVLGRLDENDYSEGVPEEEAITEVVEGAYSEIERRKDACRGGYPFAIGPRGYTMKISENRDDRRCAVYHYLLLATRLNMQSNRRHAGIDGASLLEDLSAEAAREYLGARAESMVFGHGPSGVGFENKINDLCGRLEEGDGFYRHGSGRTTANDGKLDIVAWKHFADRLPGKLIAFGQCKTGTNFRDNFADLQPDSFCKKWLHSFPAFVPVRMFFVAEALSRVNRYDIAIDAGLLFDRCRIVDFCDNVSNDVLEKMKEWTDAAARATTLPI